MIDAEMFDQDLRFVQHQVAALIEAVTKLEDSNTRLIAAFENFAERRRVRRRFEALRSEMNEYGNVNLNHEVRIREIESELHIPPSA
jgi:hypothetical protein